MGFPILELYRKLLFHFIGHLQSKLCFQYCLLFLCRFLFGQQHSKKLNDSFIIRLPRISYPDHDRMHKKQDGKESLWNSLPPLQSHHYPTGTAISLTHSFTIFSDTPATSEICSIDIPLVYSL